MHPFNYYTIRHKEKVCIFNFEGCSKFLDIISTGESLGTVFFTPRDIVRRLYNAEALPGP